MTKVAKSSNQNKRVKKSTSSAFVAADSDDSTWWYVFGIVLVLSFATRFYKVEEPDHVCWDETHFGKMASWYINRTFFFDVHPPLGKMLIALSGYMTGYDGSFQFSNPGDKYTDVNYLGMRVFCTLLGAAIVPFCFCTVWEMTRSLTAAVLSASYVLFDIGTLTLTQYILLDPILLFFVMGSVMGLAKFNSYNDRSFSKPWWFWLSFTGIMLSCAICVKFVGLFIVVYVGLHTISELWEILGDLTKPIGYSIQHFLARALCLIVLPALLYSFFFFVHLSLLNKSGHGDGFYSSAFQSQLQGNSLHNASMPRELAYGALVTLKNQRTGGGYLHSHWHLYPQGVGARQQQITTYSHKDDNNKWRVKKLDVEPEETDPITLVKHGDLIRLEHISTRRNLHSHDEIAPLSRKHYQVTGYGENGTGDANDVWQVLIVDGKKDEVVTTVSSRFRLLHFLQNCVLTATGSQLPKWAFEQQEVSCNPNLRDKNAVWNVEDNVFPKLPNVSFDVYAPSFLERFFESHAVMLQGNAGLKPKEGEVTSRPWQWPINFRGQFFSGQPYRIYLLGNPIIWWSNIVFLLSFVLVFILGAVYKQRGITLPDPAFEARRQRLKESGAWLFVGWFLHYVPFWFMGRVLYFHHYFPALLFSSMITGIVLTYILDAVLLYIPDKFKSLVYHWSVGTILATTMYSFVLFSPLAYGMAGPLANDPNSTMHSLKWMDSWEF